MRRPSTRGLIAIALLVLVAFAFGQLSAGGGGRLDATSVPQGRGVRPPTLPIPSPLPIEEAEEPLVFDSGGGQSASANGVLAVTGSYGVGTSVLYVLDTNNGQLAVYEARGGSQGMHRVVLVGARRIDLDLQLEGYNDESEFSYRELQRRFDRLGTRKPTGGASAASGSGAETPPGSRGK